MDVKGRLDEFGGSYLPYLPLPILPEQKAWTQRALIGCATLDSPAFLDSIETWMPGIETKQGECAWRTCTRMLNVFSGHSAMLYHYVISWNVRKRTSLT